MYKRLQRLYQERKCYTTQAEALKMIYIMLNNCRFLRKEVKLAAEAIKDLAMKNKKMEFKIRTEIACIRKNIDYNAYEINDDDNDDKVIDKWIEK